MKLSDKLAQSTDAKATTKAPAKKAASTAKKASTRSGATRKSAAKKATSTKATAKQAAPKASPKAAAPTTNADKAKATESGKDRLAQARAHVRDLVLAELAPRLSGPDALAGEALADEARATVDKVLAREDVKVGPAERRSFVAQLLSDLLGYGALDLLLADSEITEIMCNDFDEIWVERNGKIVTADVQFDDRRQYRAVIDKIVQQAGRRVDESSPMVDARLPDGSRVNAIIPPIALHGPVLTIRRFSEDPFTVQDLIGFGSITDDLAVLLEACVRGRLNMLVSGGTGSGKTTMLNVLSRFIPHGDRIITIEDAAELRLQQPHVVTLEARPSNAEGTGAVTIRDLVKNALRMRPDRIVVGECRGGEAMDMLQAMNTGHEGSLTTIHANTPRDALSRLETLVLMAGMDLPQRAIREQIASALDVIVQIERLPDGQRKIVSVEEVHGLEGETLITQELFRYEPKVENGRHVGHITATGLRPKFLERLAQDGVEVPAAILKPTPAPSTGRKTTARSGKGARR